MMPAKTPLDEATPIAGATDNRDPAPGTEAVLREGDAGTVVPDAAPELRQRPRSGAATIVMASLMVVFGLWWGRSFMIPLTVGLMLAMLVMPLTGWFERWLRSRVVASILTMAIVVSALGLAATAFGGQLARVAGRMPDMVSLVAQELADADQPGADSLVTRAREAFKELDRAAERFAGAKPLIQPTPSRRAKAAEASAAAAAPPPANVSISQSAGVALRDTAVSGSGALLKFAGDITIMFFIAFFLLAGGEPLTQHFLGLFGRDPDAGKRARRAAAECIRQIRIYGAVLLVTNTFVGVAVWAVFALAGLPDAAGWGVTAAVLHVVPYLGMALLTGLSAAEAFLAHGTLGAALGIAAYVVLLSTVIGTIVTAWLQGRAAKMNPAAVFIGVVFWGALWGVWGLLLGPALVVLCKVVAEHSRTGRPLARLMQG